MASYQGHATSSAKVQQVKKGEITHSYSEEEKEAFTEYINMALGKDADLRRILPLNAQDESLFAGVHDGLLLCKLINDAIPDTIDERVLNKGDINTYKKHENQTVAINSAKAIGCNVVNIGAQDLIDGIPHLVLGLIWQIVKIGLFSRINLVNHPELYRLLEEGETIEDLLKLPIEEILLRWVNYHLKNAGWPKRVNNFSGDIKDGTAYTVLLAQIAPKHCNRDPLNASSDLKRAELVLDNADKLGCRKFVAPRDIVRGNKKLNLAFVANLFNTWPALEPVEDVEIIEETREEKQFRNWMNSLGVEPFVNNLYLDLRDGLVLIQLFKQVEPGIVDDSKVNWNPTTTWKKLENDNYAVELGKQLKFSLVGIQGKDILDGNKTLTLAVVWQLMRHHVLSILKRLGGGQAIGDSDIIRWANDKVRSAGKSSSMASFKDNSLRDSKFLIDLVDAVRPGAADYSLVSDSRDDKDLLLNAKYAVSLARKIGCCVFALPEDIVEVKNKMIMTFVATVMAVDLGH
ncbi:Plastin-3 [Balamuthia mandrillaris]